MIPRRPSVLTVINYYYPYISGLSEYARLVAENMAADGMDITVLTGRHRKDLAPTEAIAGVRVIRAAPFVFLHKGSQRGSIPSRRISAIHSAPRWSPGLRLRNL